MTAGEVAFAVAGSAVVGIAVAPLAIPLAVGALGFGAGGIVSGTWAAGLMSTYAGMVPAGSVCAVLQSVGAAGLSGTTIAAMEGTAVGAAGVLGVAWRKLFGKGMPSADAPKDEDASSADGPKDEDDSSADDPSA